MENENERMVSRLLEDFPCLKYGEYIMEEMRMILNKDEKEMDTLMARTARLSVEALLAMMPKCKLKNQVNCMHGYMNDGLRIYSSRFI